jgi:hypothetical protein
MTTFQKLLIAVLLIFAVYLFLVVPYRQEKRLERLEACINDAKERYNESWNATCEGEEHCNINKFSAQFLQESLQSDKNDCHKAFNPQ